MYNYIKTNHAASNRAQYNGSSTMTYDAILEGNSTSLDVHSQNAATAKPTKPKGTVTGERFSSVYVRV